MIDRISSVRAYVRAAELGSFAAAAHELGISAQMVGRHVSALEHRLSTRLLNRTTHSQSTTEAGRILLEGCRRLLDDVERLQSDVAAVGRSPRGLLRICAPRLFGATVLLRRLPEFLAAFPEVQVEIHHSDARVDIVQQGYDASLWLGDLPDSSLLRRTLSRHRLVVCAAPSFLERHTPPVAPEDLARLDCIGATTRDRGSATTWEMTCAGQTIQVRPRIRIAIEDGRALMDGALDGAGIARISALSAAGHISAGRLVPLLANCVQPEEILGVLFTSRARQPGKLRAFIDWLAAIDDWQGD